jgi:aryl-alcohol dehydrogenase-like predicted oxidoreductase
MKQRKLGAGAPSVSELGLGVAPLTRPTASVNDLVSGIATVHRALELGVTFFDTAESYDHNNNEKILGKALKGHRHNVVVATKFGIYHEAGKPRSNHGAPANAVRACDTSLKSLNTEVIDLFYLHRVDPNVPVEETIGAMARLIEAGKVRFLGISACAADELRRAHSTHPMAALQSEYSLFSRDVENEILALCRELGIAFVPYAPLWSGVIAGTYVAKRNKGADADTLAKKDAEFLKPLTDIAATKGATVPQIAIAWLMAKGDDIIPIPGTKQVNYLEENLEAAEIDLTAEDVGKLDAAFPPGIDQRVLAARKN